MHWMSGIHHDGSSLYVSNLLPKFGERVTLRLRTPLNAPIHDVFLRTAPDGEGHHDAMHIESQDSVSTFWTVELRLRMPVTTYRFKIVTDEGTFYYNAAGISQALHPDFYDFKLLVNYAAPVWVRQTVFYQIFPDRFHNGDPATTVPPNAWSKRGFSTQQRAWGEIPLPWSEGGSLDFYGGDLPGIVQKLDYLRDLGINALYLNPIFPAETNHRYDMFDFENVDPYLGGNDALIDLRRALDESHMRLVLDITPNHISWKHPWFTTAQADEHAPTLEYFTFYDANRQKYETWKGVPSLPKLNYQSQALRDAIYRAPDSAMQRWLAEPYHIDGWRLDVWNMTAQQGMKQHGNEVGRELRSTIKHRYPDAYLMGEHFYDATSHLQGDELDAVMDYQGFNLPVRQWLSGYGAGADEDRQVETELMTSPALVEQMRHFLAAVPFVIMLQQFHQLGSHDTLRILQALNGDADLLKLGGTMLMMYPGVPCIYYGDEIGMSGGRDPDNRRCMPWDDPAAWNQDLRSYYKTLIHLRRNSSAMQHGGLQWLYAEDDVIAFQRQSAEQQLIFVGYRGANTLPEIDVPVRHAGLADGVELRDLLSGQRVRVENGFVNLRSLRHGQALILQVEP